MELNKTTAKFKIGEVEFNPHSQELIFSRFRSVQLTEQESGILLYLLQHANQAITLNELMTNCLNQQPSDPIGTRKVIQQLCAKLEIADHIEYPYIDCYRFHLDVQIKQKSLFDISRIKRWFSREHDHAACSMHS